MTPVKMLTAFLVCALGCSAGAQLVAAGDSSPTPPASTPKETAASSSVVNASISPAEPPGWQSKFHRWVDLNDFTFSGRYRSVADSNEAHEFDQSQQRSILDGKFKLDREGKYTHALNAGFIFDIKQALFGTGPVH